MDKEESDITVEFRLHADFSKFELIARPDKGQQLSPQDLINCLNYAISHIEENFGLEGPKETLPN